MKRQLYRSLTLLIALCGLGMAAGGCGTFDADREPPPPPQHPSSPPVVPPPGY